MYIYNVTINIEESVHDQWIQWMKDIHIPDMLATGKFTEARMCRVMVEEEMGGITYSIQYLTTDFQTLQRYFDEDADRLRQEGMDLFKGKFVLYIVTVHRVDRKR